MTERRIRVAIGVTVYNEERNLDALLGRLAEASERVAEVRQIVVVSSGSTDATVDIARRWAAKDARVEVIIDTERRGKATAINQLLGALRDDVEICVQVGGDLLPELDAIDALAAAFRDPRVGMAGAHPVPANPRTGWIPRVVHLQWELHHRISSRHPKMGEMVAFRANVPPLDPRTAVDEAWLETVAVGRGQELRYVPDAVVHNLGPTTAAELVAQRRRIFCGHLWLRRTRAYEVSTFRARSLLGAAGRHLVERPADAPALALAAALELGARALGTFDFLRGRQPTVWRAIDGTKGPIHPEPRR
ncbi:MAG: glycosyltransferase [Myxococcales bacterium]|nr:glycosyltransferase [Myxococcales bacterium]